MQTDHPTVDLYFVFAFTYCKVRVYKDDKDFAQKVLEANNVEFCEQGDGNFQEVDTRLLLSLVSTALPKLLKKSFDASEFFKQASNTFGIKLS